LEAMRLAGPDQASRMGTDTATFRRAATHLQRHYAHGAPQASQMDHLQVLLRSLELSLRVCHQAHSQVSLSFL
jgi:phage tail tape-measure protein